MINLFYCLFVAILAASAFGIWMHNYWAGLFMASLLCLLVMLLDKLVQDIEDINKFIG